MYAVQNSLGDAFNSADGFSALVTQHQIESGYANPPTAEEHQLFFTLLHQLPSYMAHRFGAMARVKREIMEEFNLHIGAIMKRHSPIEFLSYLHTAGILEMRREVRDTKDPVTGELHRALYYTPEARILAEFVRSHLLGNTIAYNVAIDSHDYPEEEFIAMIFWRVIKEIGEDALKLCTHIATNSFADFFEALRSKLWNEFRPRFEKEIVSERNTQMRNSNSAENLKRRADAERLSDPNAAFGGFNEPAAKRLRLSSEMCTNLPFMKCTIQGSISCTGRHDYTSKNHMKKVCRLCGLAPPTKETLQKALAICNPVAAQNAANAESDRARSSQSNLPPASGDEEEFDDYSSSGLYASPTAAPAAQERVKKQKKKKTNKEKGKGKGKGKKNRGR